MVNVFPFKSGKPKPPALDEPKKKAPVAMFGAKHEAPEPPKPEADDESASAKLAYARQLCRDLMDVLGEDEPEPEEETETEPEEA